MSGNFAGFVARAEEALEEISRMKSPLLVNHYDCDGITSGSIVCAGLRKMGKEFSVKTVRKVDGELIEELRGEREIIFSDLGGGSPAVGELSGNVVVIDHHQTAGLPHLQINPHLFGFDGGTEISASGTAYFVFHELLEIAIVGAVGDMQYPLASLNGKIVDEGAARGSVVAEIDLRMYGRHTRPLPQLLAYADDPFLPGLGGHEDRCAQFLDGVGIGKGADGKWPAYAGLSKADRKKLVGALAVYMAELSYAKAKGGRTGGEIAGKTDFLVGETYCFPAYEKFPELYDAGEFSTMLNACGRHGQPGLGMDICQGKEGAYEKGRELLALHRKQLREGIEYAYRGVRDFGPLLFLDGRGVIEDGIIGVVAGMLFPGGRLKPIVAVALDEKGMVKISTRGTKKLVASGLNLGLALKESCAMVGGAGGGHKVAAGATIPPEKIDEFLMLFCKSIEAQIGKA